MTGDYLFFNNLAKETEEFILGGKINRVSEPCAAEMVLGVYAKGEVFNLYLSASPECPHFRLGSGNFRSPDNCPSFCMFMRKHLVGGEISSFKMCYDDRILKIGVTSRDEMHYEVGYFIILEIMSRGSNIIITDEKGVIRECLRHGEISEGARTLLPGFTYEPPVNKKIFCGNTTKIYDEIVKLDTIREMIDYVKTGCAGIGKAGIAFLNEYAENCLENGKTIDTENSVLGSEIDNTKMAKIVIEALNILLEPNKYNKYQPCIMLKHSDVPNDNITKNKDKIVDCYFVTLSKNYETVERLTHAINIVMEINYATKSIDNLKKTLFSTVKKLESKVSQKIEYCKEAILGSEKADIYKKYGETIINNIYLIKDAENTLSLIDYESNMNITVPFDINLTPSQNAKRYFARYGKLKRTRENNELRMIELAEQQSKYGAILYEISEADSVELLSDIKSELVELGILKSEIKKKKGGAKPKIAQYNALKIKQYEINGFTLLVGRNNVQNNEVTFNLARAEDIWLHIKNYHGSHCLLKTEGKTVTDATLKIACEICAFHSEGKNSPKCEIDYTEKTNVKRHPSKALGLVNYYNYRTLIVEPNEQTTFLKNRL